MLTDIAEAISLPFMQRALLGGAVVSILAALIGIFVTLRRSSFYGDAIAHSSLTGVALGVLIGFNPLVAAAVYAIGISLLLPLLQSQSRLPIDSLLGFILPFSMGLGVIILALTPGYQPELISFLFGSILAIGWMDLAIITAIALVSVLIIAQLYSSLVSVSFDSEFAKVSGIRVGLIEVIYSILLALTIVAGIRIVGIILVNALLIIPASTVRLYARSLFQMFIFTPILAVITTIFGLFLSYFLNVPSGPAIAVVSGTLLILSIGAKRMPALKR